LPATGKQAASTQQDMPVAGPDKSCNHSKDKTFARTGWSEKNPDGPIK
jgi:hypothetical protein